MIEIVKGESPISKSMNPIHLAARVEMETLAFLHAIEDESTGFSFDPTPDSSYGLTYQRTKAALRNHAKGCDCMDCERIEQ